MEIKEVAEVKIDEIAEKLNKIIILDEDTWQLILYSVLSPYAPRIRINSVLVRANLHIMLVGDVATAKSRICKIVEAISPKSSRITKVTEASLEGIARRGYIELGLIDVCNDGVLIIPEFTVMYQKYKILREVMDCETITIIKGGETKQVDVNITFFAGSNPKEDFFHQGSRLRTQIPFREGILTRFDILIPLTTTCEKNEHLLDYINLFGTSEEEVDLIKINNVLSVLAREMSRVREVTLNLEQKEKVKEIFLSHNRDIGNRPLMLLRDLETISRLINVITTATRFYEKDPYYSVVEASDEDVNKAIDLWETLIDLRKALYIGTDKEILSVKEKIFQEVIELGRVKTKELEKIIVDTRNLCSRATLYRKINELRIEGRIKQDGLHDSEVSPA